MTSPRILSALVGAAIITSCNSAGSTTPSDTERDAAGRPVTPQAEAEAEALETKAAIVEEAMANGGSVAAQAEKAGAALDAEADAIRTAGERTAAAENRTN